MFDLRQPCKNCPFRQGQGELFQLHPERLREILEAPAFQCHKTVDYSCEDRESRAGDRPQQCAGLMTVLHRAGRPNQIMQLGSRLGFLDLDELDPKGEVYPSVEAALSAHGRPILSASERR